MRRLAFALLLALPNPAWGQAAAPSFDCAKATSADERTICADPRLAELDRAATLAYSRIPKDEASGARQEANDALADRRACGTDRLCIMDVQANALDSFNGYNKTPVPAPDWVGAYRLHLFESSGKPAGKGLPQQVASCSRTTITHMSGRFGGPVRPDSEGGSGSTVQFANGGALVSYSYVADIAASRIGDAALVCLTSLPKRCPPGDDRGKIYAVTNIRTKGSWVLPDSQHMCGGA